MKGKTNCVCLVVRRELLPRCERVSTVATRRGRAPYGPCALDPLFQELCYQDTTEGWGTTRLLQMHTWELFSPHLLSCICSPTLYQYAKLCTLTQSDSVSAPVPDFLFELEYCDQLNARFKRMREDRDVFYAFHGSRLENFHSIIHNGLQCHLNKVSEAFGFHIHLTRGESAVVFFFYHVMTTPWDG